MIMILNIIMYLCFFLTHPLIPRYPPCTNLSPNYRQQDLIGGQIRLTFDACERKRKQQDVARDRCPQYKDQFSKYYISYNYK